MVEIEENRQDAPAKNADEDFVRQLSQIYKKLKFAKNLKKAMKEVEGDLLALLGCKLFTIFQSVDNGKEIVATFKGGIGSDDNPDFVIKVPFTATSLAGYVALSQRPILVENVYNAEELTNIHPRLQWDKKFSESKGLFFKSMLVVPIKDEILLGVIQIINLRDDPVFNKDDLKHATMVAQMLARQFRSEFQSTQGPYDYLVQQNKISSKDLDELQKNATLYGTTVTKSLMEDFKINPDEIGKSLELYYRVPYMKYDPKITLPVELMENLGAQYLRNNLWVPISGSKEEVVILISDPSNYQRIMEIQGILNARNYVFRVGLPEHILQFLGGSQQEEEDSQGFDDVFKSLEEESTVEVDEKPDKDDEGAAATSAIIQLVNKIIVEAERLGGSDIHIEPGKDRGPGVVRVRVDGLCRELLKVPAEHTAALIARIKVMSRLDISERRLPQDGKCKLKIRGRAVELRVATVPTVQGEGAVLRILAAGSAMPLEKLNLHPEVMKNLLEITTHPHGLILVVGPTGSGKTTTLHAVLGHLNKPERKIWTAEDPVEITQPGLQQVQMQPKIGFTFATAMRAFLRADPDVILIGEMRDKETASIGVEASLTGHLVLSTLHTNSAPETLTRLLDLGLDPVNFSDALLGVLAQRLMRTLCGSCKESYTPEQRDIDHLIHEFGGEEVWARQNLPPEQWNFKRKVGCEACGGSGYRGRTGVHELLRGTREMQKMIYNKEELSVIRQQAIADGMLTLKQDGIVKIFKGFSDYQQLLRITGE